MKKGFSVFVLVLALAAVPAISSAQGISLEDASAKVSVYSNVVSTLKNIDTQRHTIHNTVVSMIGSMANEVGQVRSMPLDTQSQRALVSAKLSEISYRVGAIIPVVQSLNAIRVQEVNVLSSVRGGLVTIQQQIQ